MRATRIKTPREKCYVCKLSPDGNHWKYFDVNGVEVPVCQKLCAVRGGFIPKPEYRVKRQYSARLPGDQKTVRNNLDFWESL